ncbi:MAG: hypothetical protein C0412_13140 [Flavobacterium sp.]|nr:hypothetical protein [Flavobacterium sp.]
MSKKIEKLKEQSFTQANEKKIAFWNQRALLDGKGGTNDFIAQQLEEKALLDNFTKCNTVLDVGCGDGKVLDLIHSKFNCHAVGIDFSENFINYCKSKYSKKKIQFYHGDMQEIDKIITTKFDAIITKRSLINLDTFEAQKAVFQKIINILNPGGKFYMIENIVEGLERLNKLRQLFDLDLIEAPWHNRYLSENEIQILSKHPDIELEESINFGSTYYLLSRIVTAKIARNHNEEPRYDSEINLIAKNLPSFGDIGAPNLFIFKKNK